MNCLSSRAVFCLASPPSSSCCLPSCASLSTRSDLSLALRYWLPPSLFSSVPHPSLLFIHDIALAVLHQSQHNTHTTSCSSINRLVSFNPSMHSIISFSFSLSRALFFVSFSFESFDVLIMMFLLSVGGGQNTTLNT